MRKDEFYERSETALDHGERLSKEMGVRTWGGMGLVQNDKTLHLFIHGRWFNMKAKPRISTTLYPAIALGKMAEAAMYNGPTPQVNPNTHRGAFGYKGGDCVDNIIFGVSGTNPLDDLEIGCGMLDRFWQGQISLVHHVGVRVTTEEEYHQVVKSLISCGLKEIVDDADDHWRTYFKIGDIYLEILFFPPNGTTSSACHVDFISADPVVTLQSLQSHHRYGHEWTKLGGDDEATGMARIAKYFSIMARTPESGLWTPGE